MTMCHENSSSFILPGFYVLEKKKSIRQAEKAHVQYWGEEGEWRVYRIQLKFTGAST